MCDVAFATVIVFIEANHPSFDDEAWRPSIIGGSVSFSDPVIMPGNANQKMFVGTAQAEEQDSPMCYYKDNVKVADGPIANEGVNFVRALFSLEAYQSIPDGLGYCIPAGIEEAAMDAAENPEGRFTADDETLVVSVNGLGPAAVPSGLGNSPQAVKEMVPACVLPSSLRTSSRDGPCVPISSAAVTFEQLFWIWTTPP